MASKNLASRKRRPPQDEVQTLGNKQSDEDTDSDSDVGAAEEGAAPLVPPKKLKFVTPLKRAGPEPVENGSACSSPSASGFIIAPSQKPQAAEKKTAKKKASASKVFSEDDAISLLKGLAIFWANGKNNKWAEFHLFVKDDLGNQFTKTQVSEKIRNLKRKFNAYSERAKANGGRIDLSDPHESAVFELSKVLWGEEKVQMVENGDEEANAVSTEKEKEKEEVVEKDDGSKKRKKRKQVTENGEENEKLKKAEQGAEELLEEGDVRDAANTILSIMKLVDGNGEGNKKAKKKKKKKKTKQGDELDEKKELVMGEVQVEGNDEGNKISSKEEQVDGGSERNKKKAKKVKKTKLVDECCEEKKTIGEQKEVDEHAGKSLKEVDHDEEGKEEELLKEVKQVDEHEQEENTSKKNKQVDGRDKKKGTAKPVDGHDEENSKPAKEKQEMEIGVDEFQSAYPLLYASFNSSDYPKVAMDTCARIGLDNAQELEEKLREIHIMMHRLELKRLDLMSRLRK